VNWKSCRTQGIGTMWACRTDPAFPREVIKRHNTKHGEGEWEHL